MQRKRRKASVQPNSRREAADRPGQHGCSWEQPVPERCFSSSPVTRPNQKRKENVSEVLGLFQLKTRGALFGSAGVTHTG